MENVVIISSPFPSSRCSADSWAFPAERCCRAQPSMWGWGLSPVCCFLPQRAVGRLGGGQDIGGILIFSDLP